MPTVIQPQDLGLTILGAHLRRPHAVVWSGGMVQLLGEFGFSTEAARAALSRLAARELLARVKDGRRVYYRLTPRAHELLSEGDQRIFAFGQGAETSGDWTVLWHSLPEARRTERARLGSRLRFLGFGSVQDGIWVAPHDREAEVVALLQALGVADHAYVIVGRPAHSLDVRALLREAWSLDALMTQYEEFLAEFEPYLRPRARLALDEREAFVVRTRAVHLFRSFPFLDPELPDALMPQPRLRPKVVHTFHDVYRALAEPAERHFETVAEGALAATG